MGANNLYFPSVPQTKSIKSKNFLIMDNDKTGQPYKIYLEDLASSMIELGLIVLEDELTVDELAAINLANNPSAINVFATINEIPTLTSDLTNDSGFITSSTNLYNTNGTLTSNRTVTGGGFSLKFTGQSAFNIISPSASILDTAFGVRNNTDTGYLTQIKANGDAVFIGLNGVEAASFNSNYFNVRNNSLSLMVYDLEGLGELNHYRRSVFQREVEIRLATATTANFRIKNIDNTLIAFNITELGKVSIPLAQVGNVGLVSGDCYFDTAANILANGDLIMGRKV